MYGLLGRRAFSSGSGISKAAARRRKQLIDEILRVDHAGEVAAVSIYKGQLWALRSEKDRELIKDMQKTEDEHLQTMNALVASRRARPSFALPTANALGFLLGAATAMLGKETAMACTVGVETAIGNHYNAQIRELISRGYNDEAELLAVLQRHRDEELEHLETGLEHGAEQAPLYSLLTGVIHAGCAVAIEVAKRV